MANAVADQGAPFPITDAKQLKIIKKLRKQIKSGFKTTINWNKYQSKNHQKDKSNT